MGSRFLLPGKMIELVGPRVRAFMHRFYMRSEVAAEDYCDERVDGSGRLLYLDIPGSVSGSPPPKIHWDDAVIQEQHRRFHNGS